ncbi:MAG: 50S ribosomal protein L32e [Methanobacteriota archaeon]|nr:MAG: 50S ribosomal protein L32e [Euryarchaeota archaeon]
MADEPEPKETKRKKQAVPEPPPEEPKGPLPSATEIRAAKKAELVTWSERYGLSSEGKVDDLRKRLLAFVAKEETKEAKVEKAEGAEEKEPAAPTEGKKPAAKKAAKPEKKAERKPERKAKPKAREKEEEEEEAEVHEARPKPTLDDRLRRLLALRSAKNAQRPKFRRQEWFRYRNFGDEWRKPQGGQSKLRRHFGYRWNLPSIGYRGPREVRGLHPSGFQEVLVHNERQLDGLDAKTQAVRIAHGVGTRKRGIIEKACDDKGLRVLNRMVTE